jgi:autotransporter-associated beta strand protein
MATLIRRLRLLSALGAALAVVPAALGQTYTWIATQSSNWNSAANWSGGSIPVSGTTTDLVFNAYLDNSYAATNDIATPFIARTITLNNSSFNQSPTFGLTLVGPIQSQGTNAGIIDNGPGDLYIGPFSTSVGTNSTWNLASNTTISGTNSGQIRINDQITGSGTLTINRPSTNFANNFVLFNLFTTGAPLNNFTGGVTLQAGDIAFGNVSVSSSSANPNIGTGTLTIASTGSGLTGAAEVRGNSGVTTILTMPVTINSGATFNQIRGTVIDFGTGVTGTGGNVASGTAVTATSAGFIFEGASTYSGTTAATNSTITIRGTNGALTGTSQIEMFRNSTLTLDSNSINPDTGNTLGNQTSQDRLPDTTPVLFHNAQLNLIANATTSTTETIGTLTADGWNVVALTPQTNTGSTLTVSNLVRSNHATFDVRGVNLGGAAAGTANTAGVVLTALNGSLPSTALVGGGGAAGSTNISIIPYMTGSLAAATAATTFVTYDTNGLRALNMSTEFALAPAVGSTNNVRTIIPLVAAGAPSSANSLILGAANAGVWGFGGLSGQLTVNSGAILVNPATDYLNVGTLNFNGREALFTVISTSTINALNINSAVTNNSGLTYSGTGRTGLVNPNNVIGGPITINSGLLTVNNVAQLGGATALNLNGGGLTLAPLATGVGGDTLSLPINVGPAGGSISSAPVPANTFPSQSQVLTLTGAITGAGPLYINGAGAATTSGGGLAATGGGNVILAGDASGFSGLMVVNAGVVQIDSDARLGTNPLLIVSSGSNLNQPGTLHVTATTATNKNIYIGGLGFIQVDAGATYTVNGYISSLTTGTFRKFGGGNLLLTNQETFTSNFSVGAPSMTGNMNIISGTGVAAGGNFSGIGGTLTLRDQGAILSSNSMLVSAGSSLVLDNTGSANLSNRVNNTTMNLAGGTIVMQGSNTAASSEIFGPATVAANTGSVVEVDPGAGQTAAVYFSGPNTTSAPTPISSNGLFRAQSAGGSTLTLRAPGLGGTAAGTGQINFISNIGGSVSPTMIGTGTAQVGVVPSVFGEDSSSGAFGLVTLDTVPTNGTTGFPQYYRSRLLNTATEYASGSPDSNSGLNVRLTAATASSMTPTINSLFTDVGGSLAISPGTFLTINSGTIAMAGGTSITGGTITSPPDIDIAIYVGAGTATFGSDVSSSSVLLPVLNRTIAKAGPGTLSLTTNLTASGIGTLAIQRGTFQLGAGGSLPTTMNVFVDSGATFDLNSPGTTVAINRLAGLGTVQLGTNAGTVLQISPANYTSVFGGTIAGTGTLQIAGSGTFEFGPTYSYSGPITLNGGTLQFNDSNSGFGPTLPTVTGGAITAADGTTISYYGIQDFQRAININVGAGAGTVTLKSDASQTSRFSGPITLANGKTLSISNSTVGMYRYSGVISGTGNITWNSTDCIIDANNTYNGTTTLATASSVFGVASDSAFGNGTLVVSAAVFVYASGASHTVPNPVTLNADLTYGTTGPMFQGYDLTFGGPVTIGATRTITTTAAGKLTLTSVGGGAFGLNKAGGGTLALAGTNTYTGATAVNAGTLLVNGTTSASAAAITVAAGAELGGTGIVNGTVVVNAATTTASAGAITVNGGTFTTGSVSGGGVINNNSTSPGTFATGLDGTATTFSGTIVDGWTGPLTLAMVGPGTLTLTGTNTYSGGTNIQYGTVQVAADSNLGTGNISGSAAGTLAVTGTTTTTKSVNMSGGTVTVAAGQTLTFNGGQVTSTYLDGTGTVATGASGATFNNVTTTPSVTVTSNSSADKFVHFTNGGAFNVAPGLTTPVTLNGFTNQGSGSVTVGQNSQVNVANFQSYGTLTLNPGTFNGTSGGVTQITNTGSAPMYFNGGSRTFLSTVAQVANQNAGIDLHGNDAIVAGGLFVNNGYVYDSVGAGTHRVVADYGSLVKGAGFYQPLPRTINGGTFVAGNSPGHATTGTIVLGGPNDPNQGLSDFTWQINNAGPSSTYPSATGVSGPSANAARQVSGWGTLLAVAGTSPLATNGNFQWDATPSDKLTIHLETLLAPNDASGNSSATGGYGSAGNMTPGLMSDFDPSKSYSWRLFAYAGSYTGPTDTASLDASTNLDASGFLNPHAGRFDLVLNQPAQEMDLVFTPTAVPEPGTLVLVGASGLLAALRARRRRGR